MQTSDSTARSMHWKRIRALSDAWLYDEQPARSDDQLVVEAEARLQVRIPAALHEFYTVFGGDLEPWSVQDHLWPPSRWRLTEHGLVIAMENQGNHDWLISRDHLSVEDPPILITDIDNRSLLHPAAQTFTDFAEVWVLCTAKFSEKPLFRANGHMSEKAVAALRTSHHELFPRHFRWPSYPTELRGDRDLVLEINENEWVWLTAQDEDSFRRVVEIGESAGMDWDEVQDAPE